MTDSYYSGMQPIIYSRIVFTKSVRIQSQSLSTGPSLLCQYGSSLSPYWLFGWAGSLFTHSLKAKNVPSAEIYRQIIEWYGEVVMKMCISGTSCSMKEGQIFVIWNDLETAYYHQCGASSKVPSSDKINDFSNCCQNHCWLVKWTSDRILCWRHDLTSI